MYRYACKMLIEPAHENLSPSLLRETCAMNSLNCRFLPAKEPLITGLFSGKRPVTKRHPCR